MRQEKKRFTFMIDGLSEETFEVAALTGTEGISKLYRFDIMLLSAEHDFDLQSAINKRSTLAIFCDGAVLEFQGIIQTMEFRDDVPPFACYRAVFVPAVSRLNRTVHSRIFLGESVRDIVGTVLAEEEFSSLDFEFRLSGHYRPAEYVCQYNETNFNFISRLMENVGIFFFFEHGRDREKIIIADDIHAYSAWRENSMLRYLNVSGQNEPEGSNIVRSVTCMQKDLPRRIILKNYNYRLPSLDLTVKKTVSESGTGDVYVYGDRFDTHDEGMFLAGIRAQELLCRAKTFRAGSSSTFVRSGYILGIEKHTRREINRRFLVTDAQHEGFQNVFRISGLERISVGNEKKGFYNNTFTAVFDDVVFRPERISVKPRISGTINAHVDAEGDGKYAELDLQGRYKVRLPFDLGNPAPGKASSWIRKAEPYAGSNHGLHFPLHKGTEVILTFIDGDPDRPVISGAMSNPMTPNLIDERNDTMCAIQSSGGNRLVINDKEGEEFIGLSSPFHSSMISLGSVEGPGRGSLNMSTAGNSSTFTCGQSVGVTVGGTTTITAGNTFSAQLGTTTTLSATLGGTFTAGSSYTYNYAGNTYAMGNANAYSFYTQNLLSGLDEVIVFAGTSLPTETVMKSVNKAIGIGLIGSLVSAVACATADAGFDDTHGVSPMTAESWNWGIDMALANSMSSLLFNIASSVSLQKAAQTLMAAPVAGKITLNRSGISMIADKVGATDTVIDMQASDRISCCVPLKPSASAVPNVPTPPPLPPCSSLTMLNNSIEMLSQTSITDKMYLSLKNGEINLSTNNASTSGAMTMTSEKIGLSYMYGGLSLPGGSVSMSKDDLTLSGPQNKVSASLTNTQCSINALNTTTLTMDKNAFKAVCAQSSISVNSNGNTQLKNSNSSMVLYSFGKICMIGQVFNIG